MSGDNTETSGNADGRNWNADAGTVKGFDGAAGERICGRITQKLLEKIWGILRKDGLIGSGVSKKSLQEEKNWCIVVSI